MTQQKFADQRNDKSIISRAMIKQIAHNELIAASPTIIAEYEKQRWHVNNNIDNMDYPHRRSHNHFFTVHYLLVTSSPSFLSTLV